MPCNRCARPSSTPCSRAAILGAIEVRDEGLLDPLLIGREARIRAAAAEAGVSLTGMDIENMEHSHAAVACAVDLAAAEILNAAMPATLDTAALTVMAARGQITGGLVDGPLAFDNAISPEACAVIDFRDDPLEVRLTWDDGQRLAFPLAGADIGDLFTGPAIIDDTIQAQMESLSRLAPLHQPQSLRLIRAAQALYPDMTQTASFDTAFHASQDPLVRRFSIPRALNDKGIHR